MDHYPPDLSAILTELHQLTGEDRSLVSEIMGNNVKQARRNYLFDLAERAATRGLTFEDAARHNHERMNAEIRAHFEQRTQAPSAEEFDAAVAAAEHSESSWANDESEVRAWFAEYFAPFFIRIAKMEMLKALVDRQKNKLS